MNIFFKLINLINLDLSRLNDISFPSRSLIQYFIPFIIPTNAAISYLLISSVFINISAFSFIISINDINISER